MNSQAEGTKTPWGDRTSLLPKQLLYVLSFDFSADANGPYLTVASGPDGLRNQFGDSVVTMPEGLRCDLPIAGILKGSGEIGAHDDPESSRLILQILLDLGPSGTLLADCPGVVLFEGGPAAFRAGKSARLRGSSFVATRHETQSPSFRWFNRRQLYGVGRVDGRRPSQGPSQSWKLHFTFDLYAGF